VAWGFASAIRHDEDVEQEKFHYAEFFKTFLDPAELKQQQLKQPDNCPRSMEQVEKWYRDYLGALYRHIEYTLARDLEKSWADARVEFLFTLPTTWKDQILINRFKKIISSAGFGSHDNHTFEVGLTEAEAAAVHAAKEAVASFQVGELSKSFYG